VQAGQFWHTVIAKPTSKFGLGKFKQGGSDSQPPHGARHI
jgi:hypothetical protein